MYSESSLEEEMPATDVAPAPGSRVIEGCVEENLIPQYPPLPQLETETHKELLQ